MAGAGPNCPSNATQTKFQRSNRRTLTFTRIESASPCPMRGLSAVTALSSLMSAWAASELAVHAPIAGMRRLWRHVRLVHQLPLAACERNWVFAQAQRGIHPLTPSARLLIPLTCLACMTPWPNIAAGAINHRGTSNRVRCRVSGSRKNSRTHEKPAGGNWYGQNEVTFRLDGGDEEGALCSPKRRHHISRRDVLACGNNRSGTGMAVVIHSIVAVPTRAPRAHLHEPAIPVPVHQTGPVGPVHDIFGHADASWTSTTAIRCFPIMR